MSDAQESPTPVTPPSSRPEELLNLLEAARLLGISQRTVQRLLERGELRGTKVGRQWRFRKADLTAYVNREPVPIPAPPEEDVAGALEGLRGEAEDLTLKITTFSGDTEALETDALVPEPVVQIAHVIVQRAIQDGASDIHVEPGSNHMRVRFRVDGVLHEVAKLPLSLHAAVIARYKQMAEMNPGERRLPQDGMFTVTVGEKEYDLRANCLPTLRGEKIVMRILDRSSVMVGLNRLGFLPETLAQLDRMITRSRGLFIVTGPTGAGKSTTHYSILNRLNGVEKNVLTIEDPVEYELPGISQVAVNQKIGLKFAPALRALMRQDPDIIMVGEIRDLETAEMAMLASLTGHLLLTTLHTEDAPSAATRLTEMGAAPFLVSAAFLGAMAQRLARRLCQACRAPGEVSPPVLDEARRLAVEGGLVLPRDAVFYRAVGCDQCHRTGYHGRMGLFELLEAGPAFKAAVSRGAPAEELRAVAIQNGMRSLAVDGLLKAVDGLTTIEEVLRVL